MHGEGELTAIAGKYLGPRDENGCVRRIPSHELSTPGISPRPTSHAQQTAYSFLKRREYESGVR